MMSKYNAPTMGRTVSTYHGMRIRKFTNATRALPSVVSTTTAGVAHAGLRMPLAIAPSSLGWTLTRYGRMAVAFDRYRDSLRCDLGSGGRAQLSSVARWHLVNVGFGPWFIPPHARPPNRPHK